MVSSFLFLSFVGHFLPESLGDASLAWAFISFSTVVGIGLFSTLLVEAENLKENPETQGNLLLATGFKIAMAIGISIVGGVLILIVFLHELVLSIQQAWIVLCLISFSLPAIYCQIVAFNYFNATGYPQYEVRFVWLFNAACLVVGLGCTLLDYPISIIEYILLYVLMRWIFIICVLLFLANTIGRKNSCYIISQIYNVRTFPFIVKGTPLALCFAGESFLYFALSLTSRGMGSLEVAAYQAALHFLSLIYMISIGVGNAVAILVSGAPALNKPWFSRKILLEGLAFGGVLMLPFLIACLFCANYVAILYTSDLATVAIIAEILKISVPFLIFEFVYVVLRMALRSLGDSWAPTIATISCLNGVGLLLTWLLIEFYERSAMSIFIALTLCALILMLYLINRYLKYHHNAHNFEVNKLTDAN